MPSGEPMTKSSALMTLINEELTGGASLYHDTLREQRVRSSGGNRRPYEYGEGHGKRQDTHK